MYAHDVLDPQIFEQTFSLYRACINAHHYFTSFIYFL